MPQSLARVVIHLVFSTKLRTPWLKDKAIRSELYAYVATVLQNMDCPPILINGVEDHVHILTNLSRKLAIAEVVEKVKTSTSAWIKRKGASYHDFYWQAGYGVFSVSESKVDDVRAYVANQEEHHRRQSFQDEYRALCRKHSLEVDERYVWD
jgi:REP element-mobilizing transposase RayT